jgi:hypothetical protein
MIDINSGKVAHAVLSFVGNLGTGVKLFAVPWEYLAVDGENEHLLLNVSKERLKDASGFDKNHWPNFADETFTNEVSGDYRQAGMVCRSI